MPPIRHLVVFVSLALATGCSDSGAIAPPSYSPGSTAAAAMTEYDANKDGKLDAKELEKCPALKNALAELDKDNDRAISAGEIEAALNDFNKSRVSQYTVSCKVSRGGEPLAGADVKFIPEKFHGSSLKPASGKSDGQGIVELRVEGSKLPGISQGFYRVEVSLKDAGGQETIPAAYNAQTTLGYMVSTRVRGGIDIRIP